MFRPTYWSLVIAIALVSSPALAVEPIPLAGTTALSMTGEMSPQMHEAALRDMDRKIAESISVRPKRWQRDATSPENYVRSVKTNRAYFQKIIGVVDARNAVTMETYSNANNLSPVAETPQYRVQQVRWSVLERVTADGLLLEPKGTARGFIVALPDAGQTPEQLVGLAPGIPADAQFARRFAENGFVVLVPTLIDRGSGGSGNPAIMMTNMPHREWIYRQAYMMGRHVIGYEVQKVLTGIDWYRQQAPQGSIGVAGYGEGGLVAFYAAAVDPRIQATLVSGYFKSREQTWTEPLYRNVWGLLDQFGDAEIASLIAPRSLVVQYAEEPAMDGPTPPRPGQRDCAAPGKLTTPTFEDVEKEFSRLATLVPERLQTRRLVQTDGDAELAKMLGAVEFTATRDAPKDSRPLFDPAPRQLRQVKELEDHVQWLLRDSDIERNKAFLFKVMPEFGEIPWNYQLDFPAKPTDKFTSVAKEFVEQFWNEVIGKLDDPLPPLNPRSRKIYDEPTWTGYDVVLDSGKEGFAWGVLLLPKDLKATEKRPVVVCQHGRNGVPADLINNQKPAYQDFAARLVERGFIVLVPHNLYTKEGYYRLLSRKGNTVKASMFSVILRHHQQWLAWLATMPNVDASRIGFYGLSYGGEAAVRVPTLLPGYALSICSGDFNDWTRKVASTHDKRSFMFTNEWEMPYFNMGSTISYAELSYLMFPRPFMVERGHHDGVALDSWVASEYAKTRWFYAQFGLGDKTEIEFFNGGHAIKGAGTFSFLHKHLRWPMKIEK